MITMIPNLSTSLNNMTVEEKIKEIRRHMARNLEIAFKAPVIGVKK